MEELEGGFLGQRLGASSCIRSRFEQMEELEGGFFLEGAVGKSYEMN